MFANQPLVFNTKCARGGKKEYSQDVVCSSLEADENLIGSWASTFSTIFNTAKFMELMFHRSTMSPDIAGTSVLPSGLPVPKLFCLLHFLGLPILRVLDGGMDGLTVQTPGFLS